MNPLIVRKATDLVLERLRAFLESEPPGVPVRIPELAEEGSLPPGIIISDTDTYLAVRRVAPKILMLHCDLDDGVRRFQASQHNDPGWDFKFLEYVCKDCGQFKKTYALLTVPARDDGKPIAEVMKLGEYPPFGAPISARIQKLLGKDDLELYRKGSRSEAQGLGLGAATYFRRIVEIHWKLLVTELRRAAEKLDHADDLAVFDKALQETQFSAAVEMLKAAIPNKLLILSGENPLTLLYRPLSVQLHELTDEECLQQAADIRTVLTALLENIADVLKDQNELKSAANRLKQIKRSE